MSAIDAVDGSSTGTRVPSMWGLLRLPRFGGAKHANGYDNRFRYLRDLFTAGALAVIRYAKSSSLRCRAEAFIKG